MVVAFEDNRLNGQKNTKKQRQHHRCFYLLSDKDLFFLRQDDIEQEGHQGSCGNA